MTPGVARGAARFWAGVRYRLLDRYARWHWRREEKADRAARRPPARRP
ncbi:hypothetical protein [Actinomadura yumaensis]|uniref:Uncharacterized protein n=1 Tax=Actinomadura yumaensis TaxID=111807 RepID=A0ABW2D3T0_9ACTN